MPEDEIRPQRLRKGVFYTTPFSTKSENLFMRLDRSFYMTTPFWEPENTNRFSKRFSKCTFFKNNTIFYIIVI